MLWSMMFASVAFVTFGLLRQAWPCNPDRPRWYSREMGANLIYLLLSFLLYGNLTVMATRLLLQGLYGGDGQRLFQALQAGRHHSEVAVEQEGQQQIDEVRAHLAAVPARAVRIARPRLAQQAERHEGDGGEHHRPQHRPQPRAPA